MRKEYNTVANCKIGYRMDNFPASIAANSPAVLHKLSASRAVLQRILRAEREKWDFGDALGPE